MNRFKRMFKNSSGQGMVEYGLILALVSVVAIVSLTLLGGGVNGKFNDVNIAMGGKGAPGGSTVPAGPNKGISTDADYMVWAPLEDLPDVDVMLYLASDDDFEGNNTDGFKYVGTEKTVTIPKMIRGELVTTYYRMFTQTTVETVYAEDSNAVTSMEYMFVSSSAKSIYIDHMDTSNVTTMAGMFAYFNKPLTSFTFGNLDTQNVITMGSMFQMINVPELDLRRLDTSNVTQMDQMFASADVPNLNVSSVDIRNVVSTDDMFRGTTAVELDVRHFRTNSLVDAESMFRAINVPILDLSNFIMTPGMKVNTLYMEATIGILDMTGFDLENFTAKDWIAVNYELGSMGADTTITTAYVKTDRAAVPLNMLPFFGKGEGYMYQGLPK